MRIGLRVWVGVILTAFASPTIANAQGLYLPGGGAAHLSMGGASTATPVDAIGALYWNPAAIGRLGRSEVAVGGAFLFPNFHVDSTFPGPGGLKSGSTRSDSGVGLSSNIGIVDQYDDRWTFGLALNTLGGGSVNFPGDPSNPILSPIGPLGNNVGGPIAASLTMFQLAPTVAYKITDRLVFGFGPTVSIALASFDPAYFGGADDANGDGLGTFPTGSHSYPFWGGGFRAGLVYSITDELDVGFGYTSPQWFERWAFNSRNELGVPKTLYLTATLPAIYSWGISYRPTKKLLLSADMRYFDYKSTDLFGTPLKDGGLGWRGVFALGLGSRYQLTDRVALSAGYIYNDNPIPSVGTLFNVQAPVITQNTIAVGGTVTLTDAISASLGYAYGFHNSISGPIREATGVGTKLSAEVQLITFTLQIKFGGGCNRKPTCAPADPTPANVAASTGPQQLPSLPQ
ncbi:MAG: outer membrane protein transport protein [Planctomycetes bacterium]|nr:outer membrane protein transport protein [Planctomycetota bacterium]